MHSPEFENLSTSDRFSFYSESGSDRVYCIINKLFYMLANTQLNSLADDLLEIGYFKRKHSF